MITIQSLLLYILYSKPLKYADDNVLLKLIYHLSDTVLLQTDLDAVQKRSEEKR